MKDLVLKKKTELEDHRRRAHLIGEEGYAAEFSDEGYEAGKLGWKIITKTTIVIMPGGGAHLTLKRAEKARIWLTRSQDWIRRRSRINIKAEQEALYGSKPSPSKTQSTKKLVLRRRLKIWALYLLVAEAWTLPVFPSRNYLSTQALCERQKHHASLLPRSCQETMSRRCLRGPSPTTQRKRTNPQTFAGLNPKTPVTVTAPMQLAVTPAVANKVIATPATLFQEKAESPALPGDIEYSFEERRLAVLPGQASGIFCSFTFSQLR
uniref:Uncharacterized protein n=1 Tax=Zea mays TaxID=4577 RepID=A0A804RLC9_MAIZE